MKLNRLVFQLLALVTITSAVKVCAQTSVLSYRGEVRSGTNGFNGAASLKFAFINGTNGIVWSNSDLDQNASEPRSGVQVRVKDGFFSVPLGDTSVLNMRALPSDLFAQQLRLRIWFNDGTNGSVLMHPDQPLTSVPKSAVADALTQPLPASQIQGTLAPGAIPILDASKLGSGTLLPSQIPNVDASKITGILPDSLVSTNVFTREQRIIVVDGDSITDGDSWLRYFKNSTWFRSGTTLVLTNFATGSDGVGFGHPDELHSEGMRRISRIVINTEGFATATCSNVDLTGSRLPQKKVVIDSVSNPEICGFYSITPPEMVNSNSVFTFQTTLSERVILDGRLERGVLSRYSRFVRPLKPKAGQTAYFICYIGLNDAGRVKAGGDLWGMYEYAGGWANAYSNLMTCARADGFKTVAFTQHILRSLWTGECRNAQMTMNNYVRSQKVTETGEPLWDYLVDLEQALPNPFDRRVNSDGVHLTLEGSMIVASELDRVLRGAAHYTAPNTYFSPEIATTPIYTGTTNPSGYFSAPPGTMYLWRGGPPGQVLWVKESETNALGWVPK